MANALFNKIAGNRPKYSAFNLSYAKKFTADIGYAYPVMCDEVVPGDVWEIGNEAVVRSQPMFAPILDEIEFKTHYFFVPYRILDDDWEEFITGGDYESGALEGDSISLPTWNPSAAAKRNAGSLWDFLFGCAGVTPDADSRPLDYPRRAYQEIWNEWYRDQDLQQKVDWTQTPGTDQDDDGNALTGHGDEDLFQVAFDRDYFSAAREWQQKGVSPSLAVTISGLDQNITLENLTDTTGRKLVTYTAAAGSDRVGLGVNPSASDDARWTDPALTGASVDINQMRLSIALQKFMELNARAGSRYREFLNAHFGKTGFSDGRAQVPEYIGGTAAPVIVSEVLGTNQEVAAGELGDLGGHGIQMDQNRVGKFRCPEFGLIMGLLSFRAKRTYSEGLNRQWTRRTRYDFYFPEFAHLSEQAVLERELYLQAVKANNETVFGYSGHYDEMRVKYSMLHGKFRVGESMDHWHTSITLGARPTLGEAFIKQVQGTSVGTRHLTVNTEPHFFVNYANIIRAIRPMPAVAEPGFQGG